MEKNMECRICKICLIEKEKSEFRPNLKTCYKCQYQKNKTYLQAYYQKNKETCVKRAIAVYHHKKEIGKLDGGLITKGKIGRPVLYNI